MKQIFEKRTRIPAPASAVFAWHESPEALRRLIPPHDPVKVVSATGGIRDGARVVLAIGYWPCQMHWVALHKGYIAGIQFTDVQERGPFKSWEHTHRVLPDGSDACFLVDHVEYELPFGILGRVLGSPLVRRKLRRMFAWRHQTTLVAFAEVSPL
jgi:ligand-binding SRPBCC domain-containing protein